MPLFLLAGGEIVLGLLALRIAVWVACGWRQIRGIVARPEPDPDPGGPRDGRPQLVPVEGGATVARPFAGAQAAPGRLRPAA